VLELDKEDNWIDRVKNDGQLHGVMCEMYVLYTVKQRKTNWIGHIQGRHFLLKHDLELRDGKIGRICT